MTIFGASKLRTTTSIGLLILKRTNDLTNSSMRFREMCGVFSRHGLSMERFMTLPYSVKKFGGYPLQRLSQGSCLTWKGYMRSRTNGRKSLVVITVCLHLTTRSKTILLDGEDSNWVPGRQFLKRRSVIIEKRFLHGGSTSMKSPSTISALKFQPQLTAW